jgi:molecular chaperone DnaK
MVKQAEANAKADQERREQIETRNQLDGLVYKVEKDSKEWADRLQAGEKERLDKAIAEGKEALRTGDTSRIKAALDELNVAYSAAGASLYQSAAGTTAESPAGEAPTGGAEAGADDAVEADYEIVEDAPKEG